MTELSTQRAAIKAHLEAGKSLTNAESYRLFHCSQTPARLFELKRDYGLQIDSIWEVVEGDSATPGLRVTKRVKRYFLAKQQTEMAEATAQQDIFRQEV